MGGGAVPYPHSVLQFPSFSVVTRPKLGIPIFSLKEIADRQFVSSIRADGDPRRRSSNNPSSGRTPKGEGGELNSRSFDGRSSSSSKEEILALFKRIQLSISKGDSSTSKNRNSKQPEEKPSADALLEVLRQSRTRGKGKVEGKKEEESITPQNDSLMTADSTELPAVTNPKTTRSPSSFTRRSPIGGAPSSSRDKVQLRNEEEKSEEQSKKLEDMKLAELKEVAKSKGIRGYSKLKKSELVELLTSS